MIATKLKKSRTKTQIRSRNLKPAETNQQLIPAKFQGRENPAAAVKLASVFLVAKRPPLSVHPVMWRWLARWIWKRLGWCPDFGIEYMGVYTEEAAARHAAGGNGYFYMELPLNGSLPEEVCQFGTHDFPLSEASAEYRARRLPFVAIRREELDSQLADLGVIEERLTKVNDCIEGTCVKAV